MTTSTRLKLGFCLIIVVLVGQQLGQLPWHNQFTNSLNNWLHVPMFAVLTGVLLWIKPAWPVTKIAMAVAFIAVVSEALQIFTYRDASLTDLLLDAVGCGIALLCLRPLNAPRVVICAAVCGLITVGVPARYLLAYEHQARIFPILYTPADWRSNILLDTRATTRLTREHSWHRHQDKQVLFAQWHDTRWPGLHLAEPVKNWQGYKTLVIEVFNLESQEQPLTVGVRHNRTSGTSRYQQQVLQPGPNELHFPLSELSYDNAGAPAQIHHLMLYTTQAHANKRILLGNVRLE
jgi:hypothetical protein